MAKVAQNELAVLGFNPELIRRLSDDEILEVAKSQYRTLQRLTHPDIKGAEGEAFSRLLNEAYESLSNPDRLGRIREEFLRAKPYQRQAHETQRELDAALRREAACHAGFARYLQALALRASGEGISVLTPPACRVSIRDEERSRRDFALAAARPGNNASFYELVVTEDGTLVRNDLAGTHPLPGCRLIGAISERMLHEHNLTSATLLDQAGLGEKIFSSQRMIGSSARRQKVERVSYQVRDIPLEAFVKFLPYLETSFRKYDLLFTATNRSGVVQFALEGKVVNIEMA